MTVIEQCQSPTDWARIQRELAAHFLPEEVEWRTVGRATANSNAEVTAYVDARRVMERLDAVVGAGGWSFTWQALAVGEITTYAKKTPSTEVMLAQGTITIFGIAKSDLGTYSEIEPSKGCVSDALKRAAVQWGIARYLYDLPKIFIPLDENKNISEFELGRLQKALQKRYDAQFAPAESVSA